MDYNEVINSEPVVLVEFYASWCPHCQRMMPVVEQVKELLQGRVKVCFEHSKTDISQAK